MRTPTAPPTSWMGGIATLASAVYLVRDGHFQGRNIAILEEATLGGSLDAGGSAEQGYALRGSRT